MKKNLVSRISNKSENREREREQTECTQKFLTWIEIVSQLQIFFLLMNKNIFKVRISC